MPFSLSKEGSARALKDEEYLQAVAEEPSVRLNCPSSVACFRTDARSKQIIAKLKTIDEDQAESLLSDPRTTRTKVATTYRRVARRIYQEEVKTYIESTFKMKWQDAIKAGLKLLETIEPVQATSIEQVASQAVLGKLSPLKPLMEPGTGLTKDIEVEDEYAEYGLDQAGAENALRQELGGASSARSDTPRATCRMRRSSRTIRGAVHAKSASFFQVSQYPVEHERYSMRRTGLSRRRRRRQNCFFESYPLTTPR